MIAIENVTEATETEPKETTMESTVHIEQAATRSNRSSVERREEASADRRLRRILALATFLPALLGTGLIVHELTSWTPVPALVLLGVVFVVPFLVFLSEEF